MLDYSNKKLFFRKGNSNLLFVKRASYAYNNNGFVDQFVYGAKGLGKTSYSLWSLFGCYGNWKDALDHLFFDPKDLLQLLKIVNEAKVRVPLVTIDDAATHIAKATWYEEDSLNLSKLYNVARSVASAVIMNAPSEKVPSAITNDIKYIVKIQKMGSEKYVKKVLGDEKHIKFSKETYNYWYRKVQRGFELNSPNPYSWRKAIIYHKITYPSGKIIIASDHDTDIFPEQYPNEVFGPYESKRQETVRKLIDQCLNPENYRENKKVGRKGEDIKIHMERYHTYKSLEALGISQNKAWIMMGLGNRNTLLTSIQKSEAYLVDKAREPSLESGVVNNN